MKQKSFSSRIEIRKFLLNGHKSRNILLLCALVTFIFAVALEIRGHDPRRWEQEKLFAALEKLITTDKTERISKLADIGLKKFDEAPENKATLYFFKAHALKNEKKYEQALQHYNKGLEVNIPFDHVRVPLYQGKAEVLRLTERYDETTDLYIRCLGEINNNTYKMWALQEGWVLLRDTKRYDEADRLIAAAREAFSGDPVRMEEVSRIESELRRLKSELVTVHKLDCRFKI